MDGAHIRRLCTDRTLTQRLLYQSSANLELLAEMAVQIPFSWYSAAFTGALLRLGNRYRTAVEATGGKVVSGLLKRVGICSTTLLATYVRKADGSGGLVSDVLGHLAALGSRSELIKDQPQMVLPIVESLCGTAGRNLPEDEESTVEKLAALLRTSREHASVIATEPGAAAVAHFLVATSSPSAIAKLCRELLAATSSGPDLTLEEGIKLTQLFQVALYSRLESGTGPSQKTGLMEKVLTALRIARPVVRENMPARTILHTLESHDDAAHSAREFIARSYASTGLFWAAVAHSNAHKGDMEALSVRKSAESLAWDSIADVAEQTLNGGEPVETFQRAVLYTTNQCLAAAPTFGVKLPDSSSDLANLLRVTLQTVLFDTDALGLGATFFRNLNEELMSMEGTDGRKGDFSATTSHRILDRKTGKGVRPFFYSEMGRISRSVGTLLSRSWVIGQHDVVLDNVKRLQSFVTALCSQWSHCPFSQPETQAVEAYAQTATLFWDYLKMVLFAVVSILRTLVVEEIASPRRAASVSQSVIAADSITAEVFLHVLVIFRDLHFVASRMGSEGFGPWREVIVDIADWFGDRSAERGANDGARQPWGLDSALRNMFDGVLKVEQGKTQLAYFRSDWPTLVPAANPVRKSQELFNLLFARQTLPALDEDVVATELMPRIETLIRIDSRAPGIPTEDVELFEVAHGLSGQLFDHAGLFRSTALGFAPKYVALLFDGYPDKIDLDLIRRSYTSVIRGLSFGAAAGASDDVDITRDDVEAVDVATQLPPAEERNGGADMDDVEVIRLCLDRLYDEIDERSQALLQAAEKDGYSSTWIANRHKDAEFVVAIIEAVRNGAASNPEDDENAWAEFLRLPKGDLSRTCAERGQLVVMLIDQIRSVSLELLPELLDAIRDELLLTDRIERGDSPLWRFAFNAISSSRAFDATKKRYCVDWYLTLMKERRAPKQKHELDNMDIAERAEQTVVDQAKL